MDRRMSSCSTNGGFRRRFLFFLSFLVSIRSERDGIDANKYRSRVDERAAVYASLVNSRRVRKRKRERKERRAN